MSPYDKKIDAICDEFKANMDKAISRSVDAAFKPVIYTLFGIAIACSLLIALIKALA